MTGRFPLIPTSAAGDPFCTDAFCLEGADGDSGYAPVYDYRRYIGSSGISMTVYFSVSASSGGVLFCNTTEVPYSTNSTGNGSSSFSNVDTVAPVSFITAPGTTDPIIDFGGPGVAYNTGCLQPSRWFNGNVGLVALRNGAVVTTVSGGGVSAYSEPINNITVDVLITISSIVLQSTVPGLGSIGDDITALGLTYPSPAEGGRLATTDGLG